MFEPFGNNDVKPCREEGAADLARAIIEMIEAEAGLAAAIKAVPKYTAQFSREDYFAEEQEKWNRAADKLHAIVNRK